MRDPTKSVRHIYPYNERNDLLEYIQTELMAIAIHWSELGSSINAKVNWEHEHISKHLVLE